MASIEQYGFLPMKVLAEATATNGAATATAAAAGTGRRYLVNQIAISMSAAPSTVTQATLTVGGDTYTINLPASLIAPLVIPFARPLKSTENGTAVLSVPALGSGVVGTATIFGSLATAG